MASEKRRVLFVCHDFCAQNLPLQPWRYIHELASGLGKHDFSIFLLTNGDADRESGRQAGGYKVLKIDRLSPGNRKKMRECISSLAVDCVVWSLTPSSIAYRPLFKTLQVPVWGLFNYPIYQYRELASALKHVSFKDLRQYYRNWAVPSFLMVPFLNSDLIKGIFCQSLRNIERLHEQGVRKEKLHHLPPGLDHESWKPDSKAELRPNFTFVYAGSIREIRGINILISSFCTALRENPGIRLRILARGSDDREVRDLRERCRRKGCEENIEIEGGWLELDDLKQRIAESHSVILPFLLVPSEMPLAFLEVLAMGKPVIGTDLDGIPEMIGECGIIVKPGDQKQLVDALISMSRDKHSYALMKENCIQKMSKYPSWTDSITRLSGFILDQV